MKMDEYIGYKSLYSSYLANLDQALKSMEVTSADGKLVPQENGLLNWCSLCYQAKVSDQTMYFIGNGASATMASHMAADFSKNCECRAMAFNDIAMMTAVSNDIHYEECFAVPLARFAEPGDVLISVSSSGNSPNIIKAIENARALEMGIVTLSGMNPDNRSRSLGDLNFWIPADTYGLVEASHQALLHCWLDTFLQLYTAGS